MKQTIGWVGEGRPLMEVVRVELEESRLRAEGTQLGDLYQLRYRLDGDILALELAGGESIEVGLGEADFFDLGYSPLYNSLPVLRDGLLGTNTTRDYVMRWVQVPSLEVRLSRQRYQAVGQRVIRYQSGTFRADIEFDDMGFVTHYPGLARRIAL